MMIDLSRPGLLRQSMTCQAEETIHVTDGAETGRLRYCFPGREFLLSEREVVLPAVASGYFFPLSFLTVIGRTAGCTLLFGGTALENFSFCKASDGVSVTLRFAVHSRSTITIVRHGTDWKEGLACYRHWYAGANGARHLRPELHGCFQLWRCFFHPQLRPGSTGAQRDIEAELSLLAKEYGGAEAALFFDLAYDEKTKIRCGNRDPLLTAVPELSAVCASGLLPVLYLDAYLVQEGSAVYRHAPQDFWQTDASGQPLKIWRADEWTPCLHLPDWQAFCRRYLAEARRRFPFVGVYYDEFGFGGQFRCANAHHGHAVPLDQIAEERAFVEATAPPGMLRLAETFPSDRSLPAFHAVLSDSASLVDILRFAHPEVKVFKMTRCDCPGGEDRAFWDKALFNGEGLFLGNDLGNDVWYPASVRAKIRRNHRLLRQYADCFDASDCEPLVPLHDVVLAHRFGGGGRQILTLFNPSGTVQRVNLPAAGGSITAEVPPQTTRVVLREHGTCILVG